MNSVRDAIGGGYAHTDVISVVTKIARGTGGEGGREGGMCNTVDRGLIMSYHPSVGSTVMVRSSP